MKLKKMNIKTYFKHLFNQYPLPTMLGGGFVCLVLVIFVGFNIFNKLENSNYNSARKYENAIKTDDPDRFNYSIDSKQGYVMGYGKFESRKLVKFAEMNKNFIYIARGTEQYTSHTQTYKCGKSTCVRVYYSWDFIKNENLVSDSVSFLGRDYNGSIFKFNPNKTPASDITNSNNYYFYPGGTSVGDIRYYYETIDNGSMGTIAINSLDGFNNIIDNNPIEVFNTNIEDTIKSINDSQKIWFYGFLIIYILIGISLVLGIMYFIYY